ncbi:MAG: Ig-like domain-containing protein [Lachnospiraceae bacterium]|nr:Ig-like domain-containing protein [Lachnospiraceae bacterium]
MKKIMRSIAVCMAMSMVVTGSMQTGVYAAGGKVTGVKVTNAKKKKINLVEGKTFKLKVKVQTKGKVSKKVTYKSSNTKIVKVSKKGVVKALKAGNAKIKVTSKANKKKKAVIKVSVSAKSSNSSNQQNQNTNNQQSRNTNNQQSQNTNNQQSQNTNNQQNSSNNNTSVTPGNNNGSENNSNPGGNNPGNEENNEHLGANPDIVKRTQITLKKPAFEESEPDDTVKTVEDIYYFSVQEAGLYGALVTTNDADGKRTYFENIVEPIAADEIDKVGDGFLLRKGRDYSVKIRASFEKSEILVTAREYDIQIVKLNTVNIDFDTNASFDDLHLNDGIATNSEKIVGDYYIDVYGYLSDFTGIMLTFNKELGVWQAAVPNGDYIATINPYCYKLHDYDGYQSFDSSDKYMFETKEVRIKVKDNDIDVTVSTKISTFDSMIKEAEEIGIGDKDLKVSSIKNGVFIFTPTETGYYNIYSTGNADTRAVIYFDENGDSFTVSDDEIAGDINFGFYDMELESGQTYYIVVGAYNEDSTATRITIEKAD